MRYVPPIYEPGPAERTSYPLQVTFGCAHNRCRFCSFFKEKPFGLRPFGEIEEDLAMAREHFPYDPPVFLLDGEPTCLPMGRMRPILQAIRRTFPKSPHTNMYARFEDVWRNYTVDDLREMRELGVETLYFGLESGSDEVLAAIDKGTAVEHVVEAARRVDEAGIRFTSGIILGLGGVEGSAEHVRGTIEVLNEIQPTAGVGIVALNPQTGTPLHDDIMSGAFERPTYRDILREERQIVEGLDFGRASTVVTGGFLPGFGVVTGQIPDGKGELLEALAARPFDGRLLDRPVLMDGML